MSNLVWSKKQQLHNLPFACIQHSAALGVIVKCWLTATHTKNLHCCVGVSTYVDALCRCIYVCAHNVRQFLTLHNFNAAADGDGDGDAGVDDDADA